MQLKTPFCTLLILGLCGLAACSDDSASSNSTKSTSSSTTGTSSTSTTALGDKIGTGEACQKSVECKSTYCVEGLCVTGAGPFCGEQNCRADQVCGTDGVTCEAKKECAAKDQCGSACCSENQSCVANTCVDLCSDGRQFCGEAGSEVCCGANQGCLFNACVELGKACKDRKECEANEYCEPTLERCVEQTNQGSCSYVPPSEKFEPELLWEWTGSTQSPEYDQVMASPIVANLTDDNGDGKINEEDIPDVVFTTFTQGSYNSPGVLRVISGDTGKEHWASTGLAVPFFVRGATTPAIADIDSDGLPDIVLTVFIQDDLKRQGVMALTHEGVEKWTSDFGGLSYGGVSIANMDGQGDPEIMANGRLLNSKGEVICSSIPGAIHPSLADLDFDGIQEIIVGGKVWKLIDSTKTDGTGCAAVESTAGAAGGNNAIADLDGDSLAEIVVIGGQQISVYEDDGTLKWQKLLPRDDARHAALYRGLTCDGPFPACTEIGKTCGGGAPERCYSSGCSSRYCNRGGGPPTIADFDGDGKPDIAVAARWYYLVYKADGEIMWAHQTEDFSSGITGSSVFDFEGDGKAEVVYNDEKFLRVYRGAGSGADADGDGFNDPAILVEIPNISGTLSEYPLIVDVNNDSKAEIVVMANNYSGRVGKTGILAFGDKLNNWVPTRRIWNQHAYHVTNINEDASVPLMAKQNWREPFLNNFRQNTQGENTFNAPDLTATAEIKCQQLQVELKINLENKGSLGVRAGAVKATVYLSYEGQAEQVVGTITNSQPLSPGAISPEIFNWQAPNNVVNKMLNWRVVVDQDENGVESYNECVETNNEVTTMVQCMRQG